LNKAKPIAFTSMVVFASLYPPYDYLRLSIAAAIRSIHPPCLLDLLLAAARSW
jgi:hypothetical protein